MNFIKIKQKITLIYIYLKYIYEYQPRYIILENIFAFFKLEFEINKNLDEKNNFGYIRSFYLYIL